MPRKGFTTQHRTLGRVASWAVFGLVLLYVPVTALGLLSVKSPQDPVSFLLLGLLFGRTQTT